MDYATTLPKGYLSNSQIAQYMKCGEAYRYRYLLADLPPPSGFIIQGQSVHRAAEALHLSMLNEHPPIQLDAMLQVFSDAHDTGIVNAEIDPETEVSKGHLKDVGAMLTSKYHQVATGAGQDDKTGLQLPKVNPVAVEKTYLVNVTPAESDPIPFMAIIDLEEELTVADLKCKKTAVSQQDIDNSLQLSLYAHITGKACVRFDQLIRPTKKLDARFIRTQSIKYSADIRHALDIVREVAEDICAGRFRKTSPDNWWCSKRWCAYWGSCRGKAT